jgi:ligand-binding sensor protein
MLFSAADHAAALICLDASIQPRKHHSNFYTTCQLIKTTAPEDHNEQKVSESGGQHGNEQEDFGID